jgi:ATP-dependent Clp protease ATP-binding subunit ClpA
MQFFNKTINDIFKKASEISRNENREILTLSQIYLISIESIEISNILDEVGVDVSKLKISLQKEIDKTVKTDEVFNNIKFSSLVQEFFKSCKEAYDFRVDTLKEEKRNKKLALIDEAAFMSVLFMPDKVRNDQKELHFIHNATFKCSKIDKFADFLSDLVAICSERIYDSMGINKNGGFLEHTDEIYNDNSNKQKQQGKSSEQKNTHLEAFTTNLNEDYKKGVISGSVVGRDLELNEIIQVVSRKKKSNPMLVGEAGVGKTSIIELFASRIVDGNVPKPLKDKIIYSLNISSLIAGTKYRGEFEARMNGLMHELKENKNAILFIDEIHMVMGAGATSGGTADVSGLLKADLASGAITCIGSTTDDEYRKHITKDPAFSRRFQKINIKEPELDTMVSILEITKEQFEKHHGVTYPQEVLAKIVELSDRYMHRLRFPDKAFDLLDEAGALYSSNLKKGNVVKLEDILEIVSKKSNVKLTNEKAEIKKLQKLESSLNNKVFGQEFAIKELVKSVLIAKSGLHNKKKPFASLLFLGPTGVGKTEVVLQLSELLNMKLHRFDMSEYMEPHSVSKLFGSPPGYIGHEEGGQITEQVDKDPYSIILLDEFEKAHPKINDTLLQVLDHGILTDSSGKKVSFKNTIIIMTSNAGASELEKNTIGFPVSDEVDKDFAINVDVMKSSFSPEFRNRLSGIVPFNYLSKDVVLRVVKKHLDELSSDLKTKDISMNIASSVKSWIADNGYDRNMGARPMERIIHDKIKQPLSTEILFGKLSNGGKVKVKLKNESLTFDYE